MKKLSLLIVVALLIVGVTVALAYTPAPTERGITPDTYSGNFVSSDDDQVCYDMSALGYIGEVTSEMRGFKIDPPVDYDDGYVSTTISPDGKFLDWVSENATVLAFIIKGGPSYNVFDYVGTGFDWDKGLYSPVQFDKKKVTLPQISHYNVCYQPDPVDFEGCTPGYWRNHADRWVGVDPADDFDTTFGVDLFDPDVTLGWAIWASGGGNNAFARHATAALLNAYAKADGSNGQFVNFPYKVAEVIEMVQDAVANDTIEATKNLFEAANEAGCPLSGTRADPVVS
jgi:hypothetical protein